MTWKSKSHEIATVPIIEDVSSIIPGTASDFGCVSARRDEIHFFGKNMRKTCHIPEEKHATSQKDA